jgi:LytS/YehU family sensor histidine kinase
MLFIPFVENALKHGNIENRNESFIEISLKTSPEKVVYTVENSISRNLKLKDDIGGIGLDNVKKRLEILYVNRHKLEVSKLQNSFKIQLTLQLN